MNDQKLIEITYKFKFDKEADKEFHIQLDAEDMSLKQESRKDYPSWTDLKCGKCPNCPLNEAEHKKCPAATALVDVIDFFQKKISYDTCDVEIETQQRTYKNDNIALQKAVSSLIGIYMVTSGCPVLAKLRPMVRYHLPFASTDETMYRTLSMYLLAQYFLAKRGKKADWKMEEFGKIFDEINTVNAAFVDRLRTLGVEDSSLNAVIHLDCFALIIKTSLESSTVSRLEHMFEPFFDGE